jgi:hypothetical protein
MRIRLTQIDGKLPSLALMKLAHYRRTRGDEVYFTRHIERQRGEPAYDRTARRSSPSRPTADARS